MHASLTTDLEIVGRSFAVYVAVLMLLRIGGRRELGQVTTTDTEDDALGQMGTDISDAEQLAWAVVDPAGRIRYKTRGGTVHLTPTRVAGG